MSVPAALAAIEWGECLVPPGPVDPALAADLRRQLGIVPGWLPRLARVPWLARGFAALVGKPIAYAPPALFDLVSLVVSQDNSCRYCYGAVRSIMKFLGYREEAIVRLERDFHVADLSPVERAALDFARRVSRADPRPTQADFEAVVRAGLEPLAVVEIAAAAVASTFSNRVATLVAFPPETGLETMVDRPLFRLVRPLLAWRMRAKPRPPEPPPEPNEGPCARVVAALGDSPAAGVLRRVIDDAWASEILPRRTKALMFAVIGKALRCTYSGDEARALLGREGLRPAEFDDILTNLGSARLDAREARLVPFARETVRCQPAVIQRRMREVCEGFGPEEVLETAGIAALANAVCRLSVVLDAR
jgi:alkylhydroperoxidase family enzyme